MNHHCTKQNYFRIFFKSYVKNFYLLKIALVDTILTFDYEKFVAVAVPADDEDVVAYVVVVAVVVADVASYCRHSFEGYEIVC